MCSIERVSVFYRVGQCVLQSGSVCSIEGQCASS